MSILEQIHSPADLKALPEEEIPALCAELRSFLVENLAKTGGHLASNLGAVELTVAIDRVYSTEKDRLVFDVGHQSYVHKILTGRREAFSTLRQFGGIAGFPKPDESVHDAFVAGHASTSISVALGMARARTLTGADYDVIALIGDGALTGGLAYEGLSDAGQSGEPMVIVLNDNGMSINKNVGGMATLLSKQRVKPSYLHFKQFYRNTVGKARGLYKVLHHVKEHVKDLVLPNNMFDDMGFYYIGPVDGHDEQQLEKMLRWARDLRQPVLLHVVTQKGKGISYTEQAPEKYHGVSSFDPVTGALPAPKPDFSHVFGETLSQLADEDPTVVAITAAMQTGTGLTTFAERHPDRLYDVGIAEGHAITMASGMAKQGLKPVAAIYSSFLQRAYDMLIHDTSLQRLHLVLGVDRAGIAPVVFLVQTFSAFIDCTLPVTENDMMRVETHCNQQADNRNPCCTSTTGDNLDILQVLASQLQSVHHGCQCYNGSTMLVIVENRNIAAFLQLFFNFKATRCGNIFKIDASETRS